MESDEERAQRLLNRLTKTQREDYFSYYGSSSLFNNEWHQYGDAHHYVCMALARNVSLASILYRLSIASDNDTAEDGSHPALTQAQRETFVTELLEVLDEIIGPIETPDGSDGGTPTTTPATSNNENNTSSSGSMSSRKRKSRKSRKSKTRKSNTRKSRRK
jgi:hypothetical protein